MPFRADAIKNNADDADGRIVRGKAAHHSGGRLRLPDHIENEQHRQAIAAGEVGGGAAAPPFVGNAVEQTHDTFDYEQTGVRGRLSDKRIEECRWHSPSIEIDAWRADRR